MSMPKISDINPNISINRKDALNIIIASIAMEELAMAHILNAEGEKLQYVLGTLENQTPIEVTICDIMEVNKSIHKTLRDVIKAEMLLQFKLEDVLELAEIEDEEADCRMTLTGKKIWRDGNNMANTRPPSVEIRLFQDGVYYDSVNVSSTGNGCYSFECLPIWKQTGVKYVYTVDEVTPPGYTRRIDGYNIINTVQPGSTTITCHKKWNDEGDIGDLRPNQITVHLFQNGKQVQTAQVPKPPTGQDTATFEFANMPQFDNEGAPFVYKIDEVDLEDYTKNIVGFEITNTVKDTYKNTYTK